MDIRMVGEVMVMRPVTERVDAANSGMLKNLFVDAVNDGQRVFVLDMSAVDFMDSTGLAALMSCLKSLGGEGQITLASLSEKVGKLFKLTRLDQGIFRIFDSTDEALEFLEKQGN